MTKEEFIKEAKKLGYIEEQIQEIIEEHEEAEKNGIILLYEINLIELPKDWIMTKEEFIKEAKKFGYTENEINDILKLIEESKKDGITMKYEEILLIEHIYD